MKKEVVVYTCDNCKDRVEVEKMELPEGWGDIIMQVNGHTHTLDLCTLCIKGVGNALGERNKP
ncbi:hypothetical protein PBI_SPORTO_59 [Arthrobacter phage Sporto]|nr:hypothetical protein PBI_SPORTO_59 [Arthrobacter phage Sporto]